MRRILTLFLISCFGLTYAQDQPDYFISETYNGAYLVQGNRFEISIPEGACFDSTIEHEITVGEKFVIVQIRGEMGGRIGVLLFAKNVGQIDYGQVQMERSKYYSYSNCCVYVEELNGKLYFWDITEAFDNFEDYDCSNDSQTDMSDGYVIPRYYIFEPEAGSVKTVILNNPCSTLIENGKIVCD